MSLLVISLLVTLSIIYKQMKKLKTAKQSIQQQFNEISEVNGKLQESNEIKDQYIFQSLYGKSDYLDKVENLLKSRIVNWKHANSMIYKSRIRSSI